MGLKIIEETETELKVELRGESHGFVNILKDSLMEDERVEVASYNIDHPLEGEPVLHFSVNKGKPLNILKEAAERAKSELEEGISAL